METDFANYDPHKILSLKLACMSWQDRFWFLSKLSGEERKRLRQSIKFTNKLSRDIIEQLLNNIKTQQEKLSLSGEPQNLTSMDTAVTKIIEDISCPILKKHIQKIAQQDVQVTDAVKQLLAEGGMDVRN